METKQKQPIEGERTEKTFTQEEVNAIVGKRLAEQKSAAGKDFERREAELTEREMTLRAKELLHDRGLPEELASYLKYNDDESLEKAVGMLTDIRTTAAEKSGFIPLELNRLPKGTAEPSQPDRLRDVFVKKVR